MSVLTVKPKFLYPFSRQFPFDEVAEKIVRSMEKRNWKVPGITVEFNTYGSGEAKYKRVCRIKGENFKLEYSRFQGRLDKTWNDIAALESVYIPKQIIRVYSDESGPTYYLYVGENWEEDKDWFMNSIKVHSKLNGQPRRYLRYSGHGYKTRPSDLFFDTDLDREYSPEDEEPRVIDLEQKFKEITSWLEEFVLGYILSFPEETMKEENVVQLIPYEGPWPTVFSLCDSREAKRILQGKENPNELPLEKRHAYFGGSPRLVPLSVRCEGRYPKIATQGFIWCDVNPKINPNSNMNAISGYIYWEMFPTFGGTYLVAVRLKYANDVYVADNAKYVEKRHQIFETIAPRDRLTDEELGDAKAARGATIIPITEYKGNYKDPIVLINRELDFDEIEWLVNVE